MQSTSATLVQRARGLKAGLDSQMCMCSKGALVRCFQQGAPCQGNPRGSQCDWHPVAAPTAQQCLGITSGQARRLAPQQRPPRAAAQPPRAAPRARRLPAPRDLHLQRWSAAAGGEEAPYLYWLQLWQQRVALNAGVRPEASRLGVGAHHCIMLVSSTLNVFDCSGRCVQDERLHNSCRASPSP